MLTIFPNYAVKRTDDALWLEASHPHLFEALCAGGLSLGVAAQMGGKLADGNYRPLREFSVKFFSLGDVNSGVPRLRRLMAYIRQLKPIYRTVRQSRFCYVFAPGHVGFLAVICCWLTGKPYALYLRGDWKALTPLVFHSLQRRILAKARFVLCTGNSLRDSVATANPNAQAVVPMSPVLFVPVGAKEPTTKGAATTILFVGQILRDKGIFELLEAFAQIILEPAVILKLTYVGDGRDKPLLMKAIAEKGLQEQVSCLGLVTDPMTLAALYQQSDVFCLATYHEGFPRVLYEAMRFSLPVITTPVGQIPSVICNGKNGLLCRARSVDSLTLQLRRMVLEPVLRRTLGDAGCRTLQPLLRQWCGESHGHQVLKWLNRIGMDCVDKTQ